MSHTGSAFDPKRGYFMTKRSSSNDKNQFYVISVAQCQAWQKTDKDIYFCNNPGQGHHSATLIRYQSWELEGPWAETMYKERYVSPRVTCLDGRIGPVNWSW